MVGGGSAAWRCCGTARSCSGRWPRPRRRGGCWTVSTARCWRRSASPGRGPGNGCGPSASRPSVRSRTRSRVADPGRVCGWWSMRRWSPATARRAGPVPHSRVDSGITRRAGSNTAADHIAVTDLALAQIPESARRGTPILISADGAGSTKDWLTHLRGLRETGLDVRFSVGFTATEEVQAAIRALPECAWTPAIEADGSRRAGADVAELTGLLPGLTAAGWPAGMRVIVRRERPHPGAQLRFTDHDGWRFQTFATDTPPGYHGGAGGGLAELEARHRAHARVEDRIRCAKDTGLLSLIH